MLNNINNHADSDVRRETPARDGQPECSPSLPIKFLSDLFSYPKTRKLIFEILSDLLFYLFVKPNDLEPTVSKTRDSILRIQIFI